MSCEDQACPATKVCVTCRLDFDADGTPIYAPLVKRGRTWCCCKCGASYGEAPHPDLAPGGVDRLRARVSELERLINTPHTDDWFDAVRLEAAHQVERWGVQHDAGKEPSDWFWLLGHLAGKAVAAAVRGDVDKAKHHTISSGAALLNWFRALEGADNRMRPGIDAGGGRAS